MKNILYILLIINCQLSIIKCQAQNYADKKYYLVDSLVLDELSENDRHLLDSCLYVYHKAKDDTTRINALNNICENMINEDWTKYQFFQYELIKKEVKINKSKKLKASLAVALDNIGFIYNDQGEIKKALEYHHKSLKVKEELRDETGIATSLNNIGTIYGNKGDVTKALEYYHKSLKIREKINDKSGIAMSLNNIGTIYDNQGDVTKALEYYHKSLKIREKINDKSGIAIGLNNIGFVYDNQGELSTALEYYQKSLKIKEEMGDKNGIATSFNNIAAIFYKKKDVSKAIEYFQKSLEVREEIGDKKGIAICLNNIGGMYKNQEDISKAIEYFQKSLEVREEIGDKQGIAICLNNIGGIYKNQKELFKALDYANKSLAIAQEIGYPENIRDAAELLSQIYEQQGKNKEALEMYKLHITMRDSIKNEETQKTVLKQQAKYEYEKQKTIDDKEHEKQLAIEHQSKEKQQILAYATTAGLGFVGIFLIFVFNRLKVTRKQKDIIELAHTELEVKNKEITDSIQYAKRIQSAILPSEKVVKEYLRDSFILYKPKDIVAGDFYWLETIKTGDHHPSNFPQGENLVLFAAADCTGHGVPGAMVSVVCNNGLNRSVREHGLIEPGKILDKTREIVVQEFEKSEEEVKDGMDIALCSLEGNTLKYAGAHNPLWLIRKGELIENKADKQPIGKFENQQPYTTHTIELQKGDTIYIFSDGYADQFGGEQGKKMKTTNFKKLLLSIQGDSMDKQKELIDKAFENWKGNLEQLDDVCVIGVKI